MSLAALLTLILSAQATVTVEDVQPSSKRAPAERPLDLLSTLSPGHEGDLERLRAFFAAIEQPATRARALHDWLVTRLTYQPGSLDHAQSPDVVLKRRTANCDGYSRLFETLGNGVGLEVVRIVGLARDATGQPQAHAWNAVKLGGAWKLIDVTFDDPQVAGDLTQAEGFRTDYFLIDPQLATLDHLPTDAKWLLGAKPLSRAQFLGQGADRPATRLAGLSVGVTRFASGLSSTRIRNERALFLLLRVDGRRCGKVVKGAPEVELHCDVDDRATHHFELFSNDEETGRFRTAAEWTTARRP